MLQVYRTVLIICQPDENDQFDHLKIIAHLFKKKTKKTREEKVGMASFASPFKEMAYCNLICKISDISTKPLSFLIHSIEDKSMPKRKKRSYL